MAKPKGEPIDRGIGERIRKFRKLCNLTQKQMADRINNMDSQASATYTSVNAWENGRTRISDRNLSAMSRAIWDELKKTEYYRSGDSFLPEEIDLNGVEGFPFMYSSFNSPEEIIFYIKTGMNYLAKEVEDRIGSDIQEKEKTVKKILSLIPDEYKTAQYQWAYEMIGDYDMLYDFLIEEIQHGIFQFVNCREKFLGRRNGGATDEYKTDE